MQAQPANDNLADALEITALPFSNTVLAADGQASTNEMSEAICESDNGTWWYEFTPSLTGDYIVKSEVTGSDAEDDTDDIRLGIYTGTAHPLTEVFCFDENDGDGFGEDEKVTLTSGTTYFIQIAPRDASVIQDVTSSVIAFNNWTGAVDSDWANAGNWSLGSIPTGNSLVEISGTPDNQPIIDNAIEAVAAFILLLDGNDLTVAAGSKLTITTDERDAISLAHPNSTLQIDGQLLISGADDDGIDVDEGVLVFNSTSNCQIQNCGVGIELDNEATHILNGSMLFINLSFDGIAIEDGSTLNIGATAIIDMNTIGFDPIYLNDAQAVVNIDGTVELLSALSGVFVENGTLNISSTAEVSITNTAYGIELENASTSTIDGQVTITGIEFDGISLLDESILNIDENAVVAISFVGIDGIFMGFSSPQLNVNGQLNIEEIDTDGIDVVRGNVSIGSTGVVQISKVGDNGVEDIVGSNAGQITVTNVTDNAFTTGGTTFTNESTGTVDLSNAGSNCLDLGEEFVNNGIVIANNCDNSAIQGGTFNNNANAILRVDGTISSSSTVFAANSILEPGTSPGCIDFTLGEEFPNSTIRIDIEGRTPCAEHDLIELFDEVVLTGATLELSGSYVPEIGQEFTIINIDEIDTPATGTFNDLAEGATIVFNDVELSITYVGGDGNEVVLTADAIVPVELLAFGGKVMEENIELNWQTASEINNEGFEIQRSENGKQFKILAFVAGNGNTLETQNYQWLDEQPIAGTNYYRLKQIDFDAQYEYSEIVAIDFGGQKEQAIQLFPNPTTDVLNIQSADNELVESISIFDVNGRQVLTINQPNSQVDLSSLPNGIYALRMKIGTQLHQTYLVKE